MNVPANLKYSNDHEWCRIEGDTAVIGITDFAQSQLGDIVFVDVPTVGETLAAGAYMVLSCALGMAAALAGQAVAARFA